MILNAETIRGLTRNFRILAYGALAETMTVYPKVAMTVPSSTSQNDYGWLAEIPGMREWVGDREIKNISGSTYAIKNREFELTVGVRRSDIEDDNVGIYAPMFQELGANVAYHRDELVFELLKNGFTGLAYDGKPFFASNHKVGKKTVSNTDTGKLTRPRFQAALAAMQSQTNEAGRPLRAFMGEGERAPLLVVGPTNRALADEIVTLPTLSGGGANPDYGRARVLVLPELTGTAADYWMLLDTSRVVKPLILQVRLEPEFTRLDSADDQNVFMRSEYVYGFRDRKNAGYGFWQLAYGSDGSVA
jgi:phage major head subunit gpT-like protein